ncbi:glycosyltransferase family 4 protein [uncultured Jatrophihabitans sp.]|uniref:glycosyltransferase family 4 protein n=1 Tax=uncultured Jatrophihabitans sp. TaxID=1610747 RepID=UPI0035C96F8F
MPLFDALSDLLVDDGLELQVAHPTPSGDQGRRGDSASGSWSVPVRSRSVRVGRETFHLRSSRQFLADSALIIAELASTNLDTYGLLMQRRTPVALWGHGKAYVTAANRLDTWLEVRLCQRAVHTIVYTESGAQHLDRQGIPRDKITVAWNSTDTESLRAALQALTDAEIEQFRATHSLTASTAVFVGALDESKRLDLLLDAVPLIQAEIPDFRLAIAGGGPLQRYVDDRAASNAAIRVLPHAGLHTLALLGKTAQVCLVPGRVGLVAIDAMTLGLPLVTTDWRYHAPEHDYLRPAFSVTTQQTPVEFAAGAVSILSHQDERVTMSSAAQREAQQYSVTNMAENMHLAIREALRL